MPVLGRSRSGGPPLIKSWIRPWYQIHKFLVNILRDSLHEYEILQFNSSTVKCTTQKVCALQEDCQNAKNLK